MGGRFFKPITDHHDPVGHTQLTVVHILVHFVTRWKPLENYLKIAPWSEVTTNIGHIASRVTWLKLVELGNCTTLESSNRKWARWVKGFCNLQYEWLVLQVRYGYYKSIHQVMSIMLYLWLYVYTANIDFWEPSWLQFSSKPLGRMGDFGRRSGEGEPTGKACSVTRTCEPNDLTAFSIPNPRAMKTYEHLISVIYPH